jgi:hypothetical protein
MKADPLREGVPSSDRDPYQSNQAIPTILVGRERARLAGLVPGLSLAKVEWFSFLAYPLSGGFKPWSLLPDAIGYWLLAREKKLEPSLGSRLGFRMLIAWERKPL